MTDSPTPSEAKVLLTWEEDHFQISPGSYQVIQLAITNQGPEQDYFEIAVRGIPSEWVALDTPVVKLESGEKVNIKLSISVPESPQSRIGNYPLDIKATSQGNTSISATVSGELIIAAFQSSGRIGLLLATTQFAVAPGSSITIPVLLHNRGLTPDTFRLSVEGIPTSWISTTAAQTSLDAGQQVEIEITIRPPRTVDSGAGRRPFKLTIHSQSSPGQPTSADCILTVAVFSSFSAQLQPQQVEADQSAQIIVKNEGNSPEAFVLGWASQDDSLIFEKVQRERITPTTGGQPQTRITYNQIVEPEHLRVEPGATGQVEFRSRPRSRPIIGGDYQIPFTANVQSSSKRTVSQNGQVMGKALIPVWLLAVMGIGLITFICLAIFLINNNQNQAASATQTAQAGIGLILGGTQTAAVNQTQAAISGQEDTDGDGLVNSDEIRLGTDPNNPDTDGDELLDGDEVHNRRTNPLNPDTDGDGLSDGEEALRRGTDPLKPDTDGDGLTDGDEVQRATDPLNPDTDRDGLNDGNEVQLGTDPLNPDTDNDRLLDGQETPPCPNPLNPDSDGDGIIDGLDLDPCDPNNPSLTATAISGQPTVTQPPPPVEPTATQPPPPVEPTATQPIPATSEPTQPAPEIRGTILFESNRDGNLEIYSMSSRDPSGVRLTDNPAADIQPALAPDSFILVYVSNQGGNNDIIQTSVNRRAPINLTNNPADDQQPAWSPDGNWIAFTTNRDGNQEIYIMRNDGTELRNLTNSPSNDFAPTWCQTTGLLGGVEWIAFTSDRDGNQEIYLIKPDGSELHNISNNPANDYSPSGSGVSEQIAFVSERDGNPEIYLMNLDGSGQTNITNNGARDLDPSIGPTSEQVAFSSDRDGNLEVYIAQTNGQGAYNMTQNPAQDSNPSWR